MNLYRLELKRVCKTDVYKRQLYTSALHGVHFGTDQYDVPFADMYFE